MTTHPIGAHPVPRPGYPGSSTCNRAYLLAGVRTLLIALALLVILAGIVLL